MAGAGPGAAACEPRAGLPPAGVTRAAERTAETRRFWGGVRVFLCHYSLLTLLAPCSSAMNPLMSPAVPAERGGMKLQPQRLLQLPRGTRWLGAASAARTAPAERLRAPHERGGGTRRCPAPGPPSQGRAGGAAPSGAGLDEASPQLEVARGVRDPRTLFVLGKGKTRSRWRLLSRSGSPAGPRWSGSARARRAGQRGGARGRERLPRGGGRPGVLLASGR